MAGPSKTDKCYNCGGTLENGYSERVYEHGGSFYDQPFTQVTYFCSEKCEVEAKEESKKNDAY